MADKIESMSFENFNFHLKHSRLDKPVVFRGLISSWHAQRWTPTNLVDVFEDVKFMFRVGQRDCTEVQYEPGCQYVSATIQEFNEWSAGANCNPDNPLSEFNRETHWCYADYKHLSELFPDGEYRDTVMRLVDWSTLGFKERNGEQSTFWLGTRGAYTVCHYDTYGCNLVAQIHGRKRWMLYPPSQTNCLYPTRIPYEESSVFSQVNIKSPDLCKHPQYKQATCYEVVLEPGDLLFVPHLWWHFVENLETSISVNTWIELGNIDDRERIKEAVTRTVAHMIISQEDTCDLNSWLNPTEVLTSHTDNLSLIQSAVLASRQKTSVTLDTSAVSNQLKRNMKEIETGDGESLSPIKRIHLKESGHQSTSQSMDVVVDRKTETCSEVSPDVMLESVLLKDSSHCYTGHTLADNKISISVPGGQVSISSDTDVFISAEFEARHMKQIYPRSLCDVTTAVEPTFVDGQPGQIKTDKRRQDENSVLMGNSFTSADLAAVLLHPDVIDVVYSKLVERFHLT